MVGFITNIVIGILEGVETVEVEGGEGMVIEIGVEVGAVAISDGIGGGPTAVIGIVVAAAEINPLCFRIEPFGGEAPEEWGGISGDTEGGVVSFPKKLT